VRQGISRLTQGIAKRALAWLARWGFAMMVAFSGALAIWVAASVEVPEALPSYALQASPVYRLEVGAVVFAAGYVASLAFVLALNNRGFSELGAGGVKAHDLESTTVDQAVDEHNEILRALTASVRELRDEFADIDRRKSE
jgi:hypothetical protein